MLKVPQKADQALLLVRHLAAKNGEAVSLDEVATAADLSQGYLEEVARLLRAAGLIAGRRGAGGGYVLARPATEISVADVVVAVLGASWTAECLGESKRVHATANDAVWRKVQGQVMTTLRGITLAALAEQESTVSA